MKWLIASDIHGSALYCGELIKAFGREGADRLLLLGDLLYHVPQRRSSPSSAALKIRYSACVATARPRWTRWCCPSR